MPGCKVYDKNVLRAKAFEVSNPNTPAQQNQRTFFAELTSISTDFSDEQLRALFPQKPKTMSRRNAISKQIAQSKKDVNNQKVIDFSDIDTLGNAAVMDFGTSGCTVSNGAVNVSLDAAVQANAQYADNMFIAALVNETKGTILIPLTNAKVSVGTIAPALPSGWEASDTIHAIPFITDSIVPVTGFGSFIIKTRPEKKGSIIHH